MGIGFKEIEFGENGLKKLIDVYRNSIVKITSGKSCGTGFFIAKGIILTCAHIVESPDKNSYSKEIKVHLNESTTFANCLGFIPKPYPDLAILQVKVNNKYSVAFNHEIDFGDDLVCVGFANNGKVIESTTFTFEGDSFHPFHLLKLKGGQAVSGMSGSPIFNIKTGGVCGILKSSRGTESDLGGRGIPLATIAKSLSYHYLQNINFHRISSSWIRFLNNIQNESYNSSITQTKKELRGVWIPVYIQGEFISAICNHPVRENVIFAGSNFTTNSGTGGLYKSLDSGKSWNVCNFNLEWEIVKEIIIPNGEDEIYVITDVGVFYSLDFGDNWELLHDRFYNRNISCLKISPFDSDQILIGTLNTPLTGVTMTMTMTVISIPISNNKSKNIWDGGLHLSLDKGKNWDTYVDIKDLKSAVFSNSDPSVIYLLDLELGVIKTNDGGNTWEKINVDNKIDEYYDIAISEKTHDILCLATNKGIYLSHSGGAFWEIIDSLNGVISGEKIKYYNEIDAFIGFSKDIIFTIYTSSETQILLKNYDVNIGCVSFYKGHIYIGTKGSGIQKMDLKSKTLKDLSRDLKIPVGSSITFSDLNSNQVFIGTALGLINFNDKLKPQIIENYKLRNLWSCLIISHEKETPNLRSSNVFFSTNKGKTWEGSVSTSFKIIVTGNDEGQIATKKLDSNEWDVVSLDKTEQIWALRINKDSELFAGTRGGGLFISFDYGKTWEKRTNEFGEESNITDLALYRDPDIMLAGTGYGGMYKSEDKGKTWRKLESFKSTKAIYPIKLLNNNIICGTEGDGIFSSNDCGETWNDITNNLPSKTIKSILISPQDDIIYLGTTDGVFYSDDGGQIWSDMNYGLGDSNLSINDLNFISNDSIIASTTHGIFYYQIN